MKRSLTTISPRRRAGTMISAAACAREANTSSSSVMGVMSPWAGSKKIRRISVPMAVAPGSWFSVTANPRLAKAIDQHAHLGRLAASLRALKADEEAARRSWPAVCRGSVIHEMQQRLQIFPSLAPRLLVVLPQQVRRMIRDHHGNIVPLVPFSTRFRDSFFGVQ